jgi:alkylhydroperoxidase family enzyme
MHQEDFLLRPLLVVLVFFLPHVAGARAEGRPRLPVLTNAEAWKRLPGAPEAEQPLPMWARMLAGPMPLTTARMLELDAMHRGGDRLDARLRCLVRWAAADANGCAYSKAVAADDLRRARNAEADLADLVNHPDRLSALDRAAVVFARKMMREAHAVTDAEVKHLLDLAGEERMVALVTLLAHASFQDRVILTLGVPAEQAGGVPPLAVHFARPPARERGPQKASPAPDKPAGPVRGAEVSPEWLRLRHGLENQRARAGRIRVPSREEVLKRIGRDHPAAWQGGIVWSRVCYGYQPELTQAWFDCSGAFRKETDLSSDLKNAIFWVVTQANQCFY